MTCLVCGSAAVSSLHRGVRDFEHGLSGPADFVVCSSCGWVAQFPAPTIASLAAAYPADYRPHVSGRQASGIPGLLRRLKDRQAAMLIKKLRPFLPGDLGTAILDLGCGSGHLLYALQAEGYRELAGFDQSPALASAFAGSGIRYETRELEPATDLGGPYGAIILVNAIEHFLQPAAILAQCRRSLAAHGRVIVVTPNSDGFSHRVFGKYWSGLHAPRHTQVFNPGNFAQLASKSGFTPLHSAGLPDPGSWAVSFQNRMRSLFPAGRPASSGTAWYSLALLPIWYVCALAERALGRGSSFLTILA